MKYKKNTIRFNNKKITCFDLFFNLYSGFPLKPSILFSRLILKDKAKTARMRLEGQGSLLHKRYAAKGKDAKIPISAGLNNFFK